MAAIKPKANLSAASSHEHTTTRMPCKNTVLIGGHFPPAIAKQLGILAAEEESTKQQLLAEALDLLFEKKGKRRIKDLVL